MLCGDDVNEICVRGIRQSLLLGPELRPRLSSCLPSALVSVDSGSEMFVHERVIDADNEHLSSIFEFGVVDVGWDVVR